MQVNYLALDNIAIRYKKPLAGGDTISLMVVPLGKHCDTFTKVVKIAQQRIGADKQLVGVEVLIGIA